MNADPIRAAIVGTGFVAPFHVDGVRRTGLGEVVALVGRDAERTAALARRLRVPVATTSLDEVLADASISVVHVATPNVSHAALATAVLAAGKHLVLEKPLTTTLADARRLVRAGDAAPGHAMVTFTYRGYAMVRRARELVAAGTCGMPWLISGAYQQDWLLDPGSSNWRVDRAVGGASRVVADIGSHWFDTVEYVSGQRLARLAASVATVIPRRPPATAAAFEAGPVDGPTQPVETEDLAVLVAEFESGARGTCLVSQVTAGRRNDFWIEVAGPDASLTWRQEDPEAIAIGRTGAVERLTRERSEPEDPMGLPSLPAGHVEGWASAFRHLFEPFYREVAGRVIAGQAPYPTLRDGARAVAFTEAVLRAARSGRWEALEPVDRSGDLLA